MDQLRRISFAGLQIIVTDRNSPVWQMLSATYASIWRLTGLDVADFSF